MDEAAEREAEKQQNQPARQAGGGGEDADGRRHRASLAQGGPGSGIVRGVRDWRRTRSESIFRHRLFELRRDELASSDGADRREALVLDAPHWVNVVPRLDDGRVVLVRQWRFGIGAPTLEIPGGMVDPDESPAAAAARELVEETGYRARRLEALGEVEPNPAFLANRCTTFLATGLELVGEPVGDGWEEIRVETVPAAELSGLVARGEIRHALVIAALYLWALAEHG